MAGNILELGYRIGLDLGQTAIKAGIVAPTGAIIDPMEIPSPFLIHPEELVSKIETTIQVLLAGAASQSLPVVGIGISTTFDVDPISGCFRYTNLDFLKHWSGFPIRDHINTRFKLPVAVQSDGSAAAWGEYIYGAGRGFKSLLSLTLGTGIGGGVIQDGEHLSDTTGFAGYFGHMVIQYDGPLCERCGQQGCWELYASSSALERRARDAVQKSGYSGSIPGEPTGKDVIQAAASGDPVAKGLLTETGQFLGIGLASLLNIFNPQVVVLGGGLVYARELLLEPARTTMNRLRMKLREKVPIRVAELGAFSGVIGAAMLVK